MPSSCLWAPQVSPATTGWLSLLLLWTHWFMVGITGYLGQKPKQELCSPASMAFVDEPLLGTPAATSLGQDLLSAHLV